MYLRCFTLIAETISVYVQTWFTDEMTTPCLKILSIFMHLVGLKMRLQFDGNLIMMDIRKNQCYILETLYFYTKSQRFQAYKISAVSS